MVIQDTESYEKTQETMALLKILALGNRQVEENKVHETVERAAGGSLMPFAVLLTNDAVRDLEEICD